MFGFFGREEEQQNKEPAVPTINHFDTEAYLEVNPTVRNISTNIYKYLEEYGWSSISDGKHKFHKDFDYFNEEKYLALFDDVREGIGKGEFVSGYDHFRLFGYDEIIRGLRDYGKHITASQADDQKSDSSLDAISDKQEGLKTKDEEDIAEDTQKNTDIENEKAEFLENETPVTLEQDEAKEKTIEDEKETENLISELPIYGFSLEDYLNMEFVNDGEADLANNYLHQIGYESIISGKSKFHKDFEIFEEKKYNKLCPDIGEAVKNELLISGEDHFVHYGYIEIIEGKRHWPKEDKNRDLEKLRFINYRRKYLKENS